MMLERFSSVKRRDLITLLSAVTLLLAQLSALLPNLLKLLALTLSLKVGVMWQDVSVSLTHPAAAQSAFSRAQQDILSGYPEIAVRLLAQAGIEQTDDIGSRPVALIRTGPFRQVPCPAKMRKQASTTLRFVDEHVLERLDVSGRAGQPGQIDQFLQDFSIDPHLLMESPVTSCLSNQIS